MAGGSRLRLRAHRRSIAAARQAGGSGRAVSGLLEALDDARFQEPAIGKLSRRSRSKSRKAGGRGARAQGPRPRVGRIPAYLKVATALSNVESANFAYVRHLG